MNNSIPKSREDLRGFFAVLDNLRLKAKPQVVGGFGLTVFEVKGISLPSQNGMQYEQSIICPNPCH